MEDFILGALITGFYPQIADVLFQREQSLVLSSGPNQIIYAQIKKMYESGQTIDLLTIADSLRADEKLSQVGGVIYLCELSNKVV